MSVPASTCPITRAWPGRSASWPNWSFSAARASGGIATSAPSGDPPSVSASWPRSASGAAAASCARPTGVCSSSGTTTAARLAQRRRVPARSRRAIASSPRSSASSAQAVRAPGGVSGAIWPVNSRRVAPAASSSPATARARANPRRASTLSGWACSNCWKISVAVSASPCSSAILPRRVQPSARAGSRSRNRSASAAASSRSPTARWVRARASSPVGEGNISARSRATRSASSSRPTRVQSSACASSTRAFAPCCAAIWSSTVAAIGRSPRPCRQAYSSHCAFVGSAPTRAGSTAISSRSRAATSSGLIFSAPATILPPNRCCVEGRPPGPPTLGGERPKPARRLCERLLLHPPPHPPTLGARGGSLTLRALAARRRPPARGCRPARRCCRSPGRRGRPSRPGAAARRSAAAPRPR